MPGYNNTPFYSEEAEAALLGWCITAYDDRVADARAMHREVPTEDLHFERHQIIWSAIGALVERGKQPDMINLIAELSAHDQLEAAGGMAMIAGLDRSLPADGWDAVAIVKRRAAARRLHEAAGDTVRAMAEGKLDPEEALDALRQATAIAEGQLDTDRGRSFADVIDAAMEGAEERAASESRLAGISTGFPSWDSRSLGLCGGELHVVAGTPSMGKSTFARMLALHVAAEHGAVMIASCEMGDVEIGNAMLATSSGVPLHAIRSGPRGTNDWPRLIDAQRTLRKLPIHIRTDTRSVGQIAAASRQYAEEGDLALVIIDYLQILSSIGKRRENRALEIADWTKALKTLAVDINVPIVLLSQLSRRHVTDRRRPGLQDLRDSGAIEQDADGAFFLHRDPLPQPGEPIPKVLDDLLGTVAKHRNSEAGYDVPLRFTRPLLKIEDRTADW